MAIRYVSKERYRSEMEGMLKRYEDVGLTPVDCLTDYSDGKGKVCYADGFADGALAGGIALTLVGLFWKLLAGKEPANQARRGNNHLAYAASIKPLTDFKVPTGEDDDREENTD